MTTYNTGNPIGSTDPRDLYDNAQNMDNLGNGTAPSYPDRLGVERKSWAGMEQDFAELLASSGYQFLGDYSSAIEVTAYNQIIREAGEFWRAAASTALPYTTTGAGMPESGAFVSVGDANLRQDLANNALGSGAALVSMEGGPSVEVAVLDRVIRATSISAVEAFTGVQNFQVSLSGADAGIFEFSAANLSAEVSEDPGQKNYIAPSSDSTGASGAWARLINGGDPVSGDPVGVHLPSVPILPMEDQGLDGQAVGPSVIKIKEGFGPDKYIYWMAVTPYKYGNSQTENPSVLASLDGVNWLVPDGLVNPIVASPAGSRDHNSDCSIIFYNNQLWLYYRETLKSTSPTQNRVFLTKSSNGSTWSAPIQVLFAGPEGLLSPTVLFDGTDFFMWTSPAQGDLDRRTSSDGENWGAATTCSFTGIASGEGVWHQQVIFVNGRYEMLLNTSSGVGGAAPTSLYFSTSADGISWTAVNRVFTKAYGFESDRLYAGCLVPEDDTTTNKYEIWYSALASSSSWRVATIQAYWDGVRLRPLHNRGEKQNVWPGIDTPSASIGSLIVNKFQKSDSKLLISSDVEEIIPNEALLDLTFGNTDISQSGWDPLNPTRFIVPDEVYFVKVTANCQFSINNSGSRQLSIRVNNNIIPGVPWAVLQATSGSVTSINISGGFKVQPGDEITAVAYQQSGVSINIREAWLYIELE